VTTFGLDGLSKLLCAPQLKLGWIRVSGPDRARVAERLDAVADTYLSVGAPVALALPRLLDIAETTVAGVRTRLNTNLATLRAAFATGGYRVRTAHGGWMALLDVPPLLDDDTLTLRLLRDAHLWVHPGWFYDLDAATALALSLLPRPEAFAASCTALRTAIDRLG
jgi:aspartate/methionine/tyrosine aminotransferase